MHWDLWGPSPRCPFLPRSTTGKQPCGLARSKRSGLSVTSDHVRPLISLLEQDENAEVRWVAALALGSLGSPEAINPLVRALKDPDRYVRYGAAQALQALSWVPQNDTERAYHSIAFQDWKHVAQIGSGATGPLIEILQ